MIVECSFCLKQWEKPPYDSSMVSHSICKECMKEHYPEVED